MSHHPLPLPQAAPAVRAAPLGEDKFVDVRRNPIDCTDQADNIHALRDRGVELWVDCT